MNNIDTLLEDDWFSSEDEGADIVPPDSRPSTPPLELVEEDDSSRPVFGPQPKKGLTIGQRMEALWMCEQGDHHEKITQKTAVSKASIYRIREKAISRG